MTFQKAWTRDVTRLSERFLCFSNHSLDQLKRNQNFFSAKWEFFVSHSWSVILLYWKKSLCAVLPCKRLSPVQLYGLVSRIKSFFSKSRNMARFLKSWKPSCLSVLIRCKELWGPLLYQMVSTNAAICRRIGNAAKLCIYENLSSRH